MMLKKVSIPLLMLAFVAQLAYPVSILAQESEAGATETVSAPPPDQGTAPAAPDPAAPADDAPAQIPASDSSSGQADPDPIDSSGDQTIIPSSGAANSEESSDLIPISASSDDDSDATTTATAAAATEATSTPEDSGNASTTVKIDNNATSTNEVNVNAETGDNSAAGQGTSTVITGDAVAAANVVNVVNVNVFDSATLLAFLSRFSEGGSEAVDLRDLSFEHDGFLGCADCKVSTSTLETASSSPDMDVNATNTAVVSNAVVVRSETGGNSAGSSDGMAGIATGDAYAAANVVNVANSTFIDSKYMMMILNNFGNWAGDVVFPVASFFDGFLNSVRNQTGLGGLAVNASNTADIGSNISANSTTGDNQATSSGGLIQTGDAYSGTNVLNDVNQTHIGGGAVVLVFRIFGDWTGQLFNLPPGFVANKTQDGIELMRISDDELNGSATSSGTLSLSAINNAIIENNVEVSASTGGNSASSTGFSGISTGDAYAAANVVNVANTTNMGRNWIGAIINLFGNWGGNISFGQPDLWIGTKSSSESSNRPGTAVDFEYTIRNNGDAPAHDVILQHIFGSNHMYFSSGDGSQKIGTLSPGESKTISVKALINSNLPYGQTAVSSNIEVTETETDGNPSDNKDVITVIAENPFTYNRSYSYMTSNPSLSITKTNDATTTLFASSSVNYTIRVINSGSRADTAVLEDRIMDPSGEVIHAENWDLDYIEEGEEIEVSYSAFFPASSTPGIYMNTAQVKAAGYESRLATSSIVIGTATATVQEEVPPPLVKKPLKKMAAKKPAFKPNISDITYGPYYPADVVFGGFFKYLAQKGAASPALAGSKGTLEKNRNFLASVFDSVSTSAKRFRDMFW